MEKIQTSKTIARYNKVVARLLYQTPELFGIITPISASDIKKRGFYKGKSGITVSRTPQEIAVELRNLERALKPGGTDLVKFGNIIVPRFVRENFRAAEKRAIRKAKKEGVKIERSEPPKSRREFLQKKLVRENYGDSARARLQSSLYKQNYIKSLWREYPNAETLVRLANNFTGEELYLFSVQDPRFKIQFNYFIFEKELQGALLEELLRKKLSEKRKREAQKRKKKKR